MQGKAEGGTKRKFRKQPNIKSELNKWGETQQRSQIVSVCMTNVIFIALTRIKKPEG